MKKTLYQVLGVEPAASAGDIAAAHQRAMQQFDSHAHDRNDWIIVREAFAVLGNPARRAAYDQSLAAPPAAAVLATPQGLDIDDAVSGLPWKKILIGGLCVAAVLGFVRMRAPKVAAPAKALAIQEKQIDIAYDDKAPGPAAAAAPSGAGDSTLSGEALYARLSPSVASIAVLAADGRPIAGGSGVAIGPDAMITNCHVAKAGPRLQVKINKGTHDATIATADEEHDLCLLQVPGMAARAVEIGSSSQLKTGQKVLALGSPRGLDLTISDGIVSSLRVVDGGTIIQTTAPVSPGSSGGGLFDTAGRLVGIITFQRVDGQNLNFAAPSDWIATMKTRPVGNGFFKEMSSDGDGEQRAAQVNSPAAQVVGSWHCREAIGGRALTIDFRSGGSLVARVDNKNVGGQWAFDGNRMSIAFSGARNDMKVESWSAAKIILNEGGGERLICTRQ
jgi:serine protease Do